MSSFVKGYQGDASAHSQQTNREGPKFLANTSRANSCPNPLKKASFGSSSSITKVESFPGMGYRGYQGGILMRLKPKHRDEFYKGHVLSWTDFELERRNPSSSEPTQGLCMGNYSSDEKRT